jgi:hypothetical protein
MLLGHSSRGYASRPCPQDFSNYAFLDIGQCRFSTSLYEVNVIFWFAFGRDLAWTGTEAGMCRPRSKRRHALFYALPCESVELAR